MIGLCKLCGQNGELRNSHIIPRSFIHKIKKAGKSKEVHAVMGRKRRPVEFHQSGIWDSRILCGSCEERLGPWDTYGFKLFGSPPGNNNPINSDSDIPAFVLRKIDYTKLKLFLLSLLWRAAVTDHVFFDGIDLGHYQSGIGQLLLSGDPGAPEDFATIIYRMIGLSDVHQRIIYAPWRAEIDGVNYCFLYLPCLKIQIKIDECPIPEPLRPAVLRPADENIVVPVFRQKAEEFFLTQAKQTMRRRNLDIA